MKIKRLTIHMVDRILIVLHNKIQFFNHAGVPDNYKVLSHIEDVLLRSVPDRKKRSLKKKKKKLNQKRT